MERPRGLVAGVICVFAVACGGSVDGPSEGSSGGSAGAGAGGVGNGGSAGTAVDPDCYAACTAKGEAPKLCQDYCGFGGKGGNAGGGGKGGSGSTGGSVGVGGSAASGGSAGQAAAGGTGGKYDPAPEKDCISCWQEQAETVGSCAEQYKACEASLACSQLQWCPSLCGSPDCVDECNDIIPQGVAPLTNLVQCMACGNGPCATECAGSVVLSYCK